MDGVSFAGRIGPGAPILDASVTYFGLIELSHTAKSRLQAENGGGFNAFAALFRSHQEE